MSRHVTNVENIYHKLASGGEDHEDIWNQHNVDSFDTSINKYVKKCITYTQKYKEIG